MPDQVELEMRKEPRQARSRALVQSLIDATARVLTEEGYQAANTNRIAEVAGVSVGSLYQYFPGKDALVFAVAREQSERRRALLVQAMTTTGLDGDIRAMVQAFVHGMIRAYAETAPIQRALTEQMLHLGLDHYQRLRMDFEQLLTGWLALNRHRVRLRDLGSASFVLFMSVEMTVRGALLFEPSRLHDPALEAELVDMIVRYLTDES
ncbi:MAG: TetR/AcrR family transcriptional regulator [Myxococcota bacterium]